MSQPKAFAAAAASFEVFAATDVPPQNVTWFFDPENLLSLAQPSETIFAAAERRKLNVDRMAVCTQAVANLDPIHPSYISTETPLAITFEPHKPIQRISLRVSKNLDTLDEREARTEQNYVQYGPVSQNPNVKKLLGLQPGKHASFGTIPWPKNGAMSTGSHILDSSGLHLELTVKGLKRGYDIGQIVVNLGSIIDPESAIVFNPPKNSRRKANELSLALVGPDDRRFRLMLELLSIAEQTANAEANDADG